MSSAFMEKLQSGVVLFDGAMGTCLYQSGVHLGVCFDALNLDDPAMVRQLHEEYVNAGAQVIQTNTFGANAFKLGRHHMEERMIDINRAGAKLAREAAGEAALVAGSVGPLGVKLEPWGPTSKEEAREAFRAQGAALCEEGVDVFILESFADPIELAEAVRGVRESCAAVPIIAQMTLNTEGRSLYGTPIEEVLPFVEEAKPDVIGLNCTVGPEVMLEALEKVIGRTSLPVSVQPNAGLPKQLEERFFYLSSPDYFARYGKRFVEGGARIVGGCCGTTPEHIRALARSLRAVRPAGRITVKPIKKKGNGEKEIEKIPTVAKSNLGEKIANGELITSVELLPPRGWDLTKIMQLTKMMEEGGFDAVNIPDGPRASARLSPLAMAVHVQKDCERIEPVLHYVCRDRNLLGMQADLLGAYSLGLRNLLVITGDPPVKGDYPEATPVFDVDAIGLTNLVERLNEGHDVGGRNIGKPTGFLIGVGANPTAIAWEREIERFYWKVDAGAEYAVTQPMFEVEALHRFLEATKDFHIPTVAGIWPLQSLRNAEFLHNEVPGVTIPDPVMERMRAVAGKPEAEREVGLEIAREMAIQVLPVVAGLQISAPFNRGEIARRLLESLSEELSGTGGSAE